MLRVREIDIYYGDIQAVREVSLHVGKGEIVSIVGSNGAGKTTTLGALSGLIPIRSGEINFLGERIDGVSPHKIVEKGLVQIPEGRLLFPEMTVLENLEAGAYAKKFRKYVHERLEEVYGFFARLKLIKTGNPIKTLEMKYIPAVGDSLGVENMFYLSGDSWRLKGEIINFKFANDFLGLPEKCYKTVEFNGRFLGRLPPRTKGALLHTEIIEGGESRVFKLFRDTKLFSWFAEVDSFSVDYERVDNSVGLYMYLKTDGSVDLR